MPASHGHNLFVGLDIDDILIASSSDDQYMAHLQDVLQSLSEHNLKISVKKSEFAAAEVSFLKCTMSIKGICSFPTPSTLRRFLGMVGYYRRFIHHFADMACPLHDLISQYNKKLKDGCLILILH